MKFDAFQRSALATTAATYLLIMVGALVRAAGAGLGCPDWPQCFGLWIPPTTAAEVPAPYDASKFSFANTWLEYINRLLGVSVGLLILVTLALAILHYRRTPRVLWPTVAAFVLVGVQGWLGGQVVRSLLRPIVLTAHLVLALVIVSLLLYATVSAFFPPDVRNQRLPVSRVWVGRAALSAAALVLVQVAVGALVRGEVQELAASGLPRAQWVEGLSALDIVHRNLAVLVTAIVGAVTWLSHSHVEPDRWLRAASLAAVVLVGLQVGAGLALVYADFPRAMQVAHLGGASLLLGALTMVTMLAYRLGPPIESPAVESVSVSVAG